MALGFLIGEAWYKPIMPVFIAKRENWRSTTRLIVFVFHHI